MKSHKKIDDVLAYLEKQVDFLLRPENIISWYHNGENILIRSQSELLEKLSSIPQHPALKGFLIPLTIYQNFGFYSANIVIKFQSK